MINLTAYYAVRLIITFVDVNKTYLILSYLILTCQHSVIVVIIWNDSRSRDLTCVQLDQHCPVAIIKTISNISLRIKRLWPPDNLATQWLPLVFCTLWHAEH